MYFPMISVNQREKWKSLENIHTHIYLVRFARLIAPKPRAWLLLRAENSQRDSHSPGTVKCGH